MPQRFAPMFAKYEERIRELEEQLEAALTALRLVDECRLALIEDGYGYLADAAREGLGSNPASRPAATDTPFEQPRMQQIGESLPAKEPSA